MSSIFDVHPAAVADYLEFVRLFLLIADDRAVAVRGSCAGEGAHDAVASILDQYPHRAATR